MKSAKNTMAIRVVGLGAGGHAKVVMETLRAAGGYEIVGLLDPDPALVGKKVLGVAVLGDDGLLAELRKDGVQHGFVGVGGAADTRVRRGLSARLRNAGFKIVRAVHPGAVVSESAILGDGAQVFAGAVINAEARLGDDVVINTCACVDHDAVLGAGVHIAPGARVCGAVIIEEGAYIGAGAVLRERIRVGRGAIIGAGAVAVGDVPAGVTVVGVPARPLGNGGTSG